MFGRTLVIVNPAARSGKAAEVAAHAALIFDRIQKRQSQPMRLTFRYTVGVSERRSRWPKGRRRGKAGSPRSCARRRRANKRSGKWTHESSDQSTPNARPYPLWQW